MFQTRDTRNEKHATFIGGNLNALHASDLEESRFVKLLIPTKSEYYEVQQRPIVDLDDLCELRVNFTTDLPVAIQYKDMMITNVAAISIMPAMGEENSYVRICAANDIGLAMIIPDKERYCLYASDISVEDDLMLFMKVDIVYHETVDMKYPYVWMDHEIVGDEYKYIVKAKLSPLHIIPVTIAEYDAEAIQIFADHNTILHRLNNSNELAALPYTSILVDENYQCYMIDGINDIYVNIHVVPEIETDGVGFPYTDFVNLEKDYMFKHYIDSRALVIKVNDKGKEDMQIICNGPEDDERVQEILGELYEYYDKICDPNIIPIEESFDNFMEDAVLSSCIIVDSPNSQLLLLNLDTHNYTRVI